MSSNPILVVGSLNTDLVATVSRFPRAGETVTGTEFLTTCGGKGANQAYAAAALGGKVTMLGCVGDDDFGRSQIENLTEVGVDARAITQDPTRPTGTAIIEVEQTGENRIIVIPGANAGMTAERIEANEDLFREANTVLLQLEIPHTAVARAIEIALSHRTRIILDPAPAAALPADWYENTTILTPNLSELAALTEVSLDEATSLEALADSARTLISRGTQIIIVKLGSRGALYTTAEEFRHFPAPAVDVVDSTAAGDCFNAGLAVALSEGAALEDAIPFAIAGASISVTRPGAQTAMPKRFELPESAMIGTPR